MYNNCLVFVQSVLFILSVREARNEWRSITAEDEENDKRQQTGDSFHPSTAYQTMILWVQTCILYDNKSTKENISKIPNYT